MKSHNKTATKYDSRVERKTRELQWVRLGAMRVSPVAQRDLKQTHVNTLVSHFDIEMLGNPEVNFRDGHYYIMDGQHRVAAIKVWLGDGWEDQHVECWVTNGLTEREEAQAFLDLNRKLNIKPFDFFRVAVQAGRSLETNVKAAVEAEGLCVAKNKVRAGSISAVGTLCRVFQRDGNDALRSTLRIIRDAYGSAGLESAVIDGVGMVCGRYGGAFDEALAIEALRRSLGGVAGLLNTAAQIRQKTGSAANQCVAAAAVSTINRKLRGANKLPDWWS